MRCSGRGSRRGTSTSCSRTPRTSASSRRRQSTPAERCPAAPQPFQAIDDALGTALSTLMFAGPEDELTLTHNAQPAILAHSAAVFAVVRDKVATPAAAAGHSLGEYSAYVTAGALPAADAAKLVRRRGELMHKAGTERPGTMAAI